MQALGEGQWDAEIPSLGRRAELVKQNQFNINGDGIASLHREQRKQKSPLPMVSELVIMFFLMVKLWRGEWHDPRG